MSKILFNGFIFLLALVIIKASNHENPEFETPDLTVEYSKGSDIIHLEAFKTTENTKIIDSKASNDYGKLKWKSLGHPCLIQISEATKNEQSNWYETKSDGFSIKVSMLTQEHRELFKKEIIDKYKIVVNTKQIEHLIASTVKCSIRLVCPSSNNKSITQTINGKARNLRVFPLQIEFDANEYQMSCLNKAEKSGTNINIECTITKEGKLSKVNTLTIEYNQLAENSIIDKLFGDADSVYVSRNQIADLSQEVFSLLRIREEYDIPESAFKENFSHDLIKKASESMYKSVDFNKALQSLSKYNMNDLKPETIKSDFSKLLKVKKTGTKTHIVLNRDHYDKKFNKDSANYEGSLSGSGYGLSVEAAAKVAKDKERVWERSEKSLDDQLSELNKETNNEIEWKRDGEKIIPKSIKLTKIVKAKLKNDFKLERIRIEKRDVLFERPFTLYSKQVVKGLNETKNASTSRHPGPYPVGMVTMIASSKVNEWFNRLGEGTGEYLGWYICDGRNGTPDLRGRFLVGRDDLSQSDYNEVGNIGGANKVQLTEEQMPIHTHVDNGHNHEMSLYTHRALRGFGSSVGGSFIGFGTSSGYNYELGKSRKRRAFSRDDDNHYHKINGTSYTAYANLRNAGGNAEHENRPPFYVVVYIVYLGL